MRWVWPLRGLGLLVVAAATAAVVPAVRPGPAPGEPRAEPTRADRAAALLGDADYPREYEVESWSDKGADVFDPDDRPGKFDRACGELGALFPAFTGDRTGAAARAEIPPGPYEDANWDSTDYVEAVGAARGARWDPARAADVLAGCRTETSDDRTLTVTLRRLDPPGPGAVAARVTYRQGDGARVEVGVAVVPVGGQLVVLLAATLAEFDEDMFVRLAAAATEKAADHLG